MCWIKIFLSVGTITSIWDSLSHYWSQLELELTICTVLPLSYTIYLPIQHKAIATQPGRKMRTVYWNNFKDAGLTGEFSFIKVWKMIHHSIYLKLKVKSKWKNENKAKILLAYTFYWMRNKLFTGDIQKYFRISVRICKKKKIEKLRMKHEFYQICT